MTGRPKKKTEKVVDKLLMTEFEQSLVSGMHDLMNQKGEFVHANYKE